MKKDDFLEIFREEAEERVRRSQEMLSRLGKEPELLGDLMREAHTLKGSARMVGLEKASELAHGIEDVLKAIRDGKLEYREEIGNFLIEALELLLRMTGNEDVEGYDAIMEKIAGLLGKEAEEKVQGETEKKEKKVEKLRLERKKEKAKGGGKKKKAERRRAKRERTPGFLRVAPEKLENAVNIAEDAFIKATSLKLEDLPREVQMGLSGIERDLKELQEELSEMRLLPISDLYSAFTDAIGEIAARFGKEVELVLEGSDVMLDRRIIDHLREPMIHILRNAVDHGIELPEERLKLGKNRKGRIIIRAFDEGKRIKIEIEDDGRGIDLEKVRRKAIEKGFVSEKDSRELSDSRILEFIFGQGFSTKDEITEISGRGFGMDIVRAKLEEIGGSVEVETIPGRGTKFSLYVPLTLATQRIILFRLDEDYFGVTSTSLSKIYAFDRERTHFIEGRPYFDIEERRVPLYNLRAAFGSDRADGRRMLLNRDHDGAFLVDEVLTETETVVRKFRNFLGQARGVVGYTFYAGRVVVLLNLEKMKAESLARLSIGDEGQVGVVSAEARPPEENIVESEPKEAKRRILVVEDSAISREFITRIVSDLGHEVFTAENGKEALETLKSVDVDLVITDIKMPEMDGLELTRKIRKDPGLREKPIIIVTSRDKEEEMREGLGAGADAYLVKGKFTPEELKEKVKWLLG